MRFLKTKIARALELSELRNDSQPPAIESKALEAETQASSPVNADEFRPGKSKNSWASGNNIMKNYCRAFVNFAISPLASAYLPNNPEEDGISSARFKQILHLKRKRTNCIKGLRSLLLQEESDSNEMKAFKRMLQKSCEVFLKFYCVNWIFHSKIGDRRKHLSYQGKMLRRVRDPEHFTYLENFVKRDYYQYT